MGAQPGVTRARAGGKYTYLYVGTNVRGGRWHCSFADRSINRAAGLYCCPRVPTARSLRVLILINFWKQILLFHADAASKEKRDFAPLCFVRKSLQRAVAAPLGCEAGLCGAALRAGGRGRGGVRLPAVPGGTEHRWARVFPSAVRTCVQSCRIMTLKQAAVRGCKARF